MTSRKFSFNLISRQTGRLYHSFPISDRNFLQISCWLIWIISLNVIWLFRTLSALPSLIKNWRRYKLRLSFQLLCINNCFFIINFLTLFFNYLNAFPLFIQNFFILSPVVSKRFESLRQIDFVFICLTITLSEDHRWLQDLSDIVNLWKLYKKRDKIDQLPIIFIIEPSFYRQCVLLV